MSNKLKTKVDKLVGEYNWYIAGGGAAYWHIENYAEYESRDLHDMNYYESIHQLIFPSDIEGYAVNKVEFDFEGKYGVIPVRLNELPKEKFELSILDPLKGIYVLTKDAIISRYQTAQDKNKLEKRNTRVALLKIIQQKIGITEENVKRNMPSVNLAGQIAQGIKLKSIKQ